MILKFASYDEVVKFHGHSCPGLVMGYRMTIAALERLNSLRSKDEEIVAIVENDACGTDAVQYLSGCTFGKGNFIFRDYGKMVYTFYCRDSVRAIRVSRNPAFIEKFKQNNLEKDEIIDLILTCKETDFLKLQEVKIDLPPKAQLHANVVCQKCGESVMETHINIINSKKFCLPCAKKDTPSQPSPVERM